MFNWAYAVSCYYNYARVEKVDGDGKMWHPSSNRHSPNLL